MMNVVSREKFDAGKVSIQLGMEKVVLAKPRCGALRSRALWCWALIMAVLAFSAQAADLIVSEGMVTVSTSAAYDAIVVSGGATLTVNGGAALTATSVSVGKDGTAGTLALAGGASLAVAEVLHLSTNTALTCGGAITVSDGAALSAVVLVGEGTSNNGTQTSAGSCITLGEGGTWTGSAKMTSDVGLKVMFAGGTMKPLQNTAQTLFHNAADKGALLEIAIEPEHDAIFDTSELTGSMWIVYVYSWVGRFTISGEGDIVIRDSRGMNAKGYLILPGSRTNSEFPFVGGLRIESGLGRCQGDGVLGGGRVWQVTPAGKLFLNTSGNAVTAQSMAYITGGGTVANVADAQASVTFTEALQTNDISYVGNISFVYAPGTGGCLRWLTALPTKLSVVSGIVEAVAFPCPGCFRSYRFKIDDVKGRGDGAPQLSELTFYDGATNVTAKRTAVTWGTKRAVGSQTPDKLFDGNVNTKWCDFSFSTSATAADAEDCWVQVDFPSVQRITSYTWSTGNDSPHRDPTAWRILGSNDGGETWQVLDTRTNFVATAERCVLAGTFAVDEADTAIVNWNESVAIATGGAGSFRLDGRTLNVTEASLLAGCVWTNGATVRTGGSTGTNLLTNLRLTGDTSLVKVGTNTAIVLGANSHTGVTHVAGGRLIFGGFGTTNKYFRFTIRKNGGDTGATQISEFAFYDPTGARTGLNLTLATKGTAATALAPGSVALCGDWTQNTSESVVKLFDGNLGTKWCQTGRVPSTGAEDTWIGFVCRLAENAPPVASFLMATANDAITRSPTSWVLEASPDGAMWTTVDERESAAYPSAFKAWYNMGCPYAFSGYEATPVQAFAPESEVSVAGGATLDLSKSATKVAHMAVDMDGTGDGTIIGLDAATAGTLDVRGLADGVRLADCTLPLILVDSVHAENFRAWQVLRDGVPTQKRLVFQGGRLVIPPRGFCVIFR